MSERMDRRQFLGRAARAAAAGAALSGVEGLGAETAPADSARGTPPDPPLGKGGSTQPAGMRPAGTQPGLEWRNRQPGMGYARLGRTNFMTSRCVFGAGGLYMGAGGDLKLLELAIERGMNYIDTGRAYRNSEAAIAGIAKRHRDKCWIVSKAGHIGWPDMTIRPGQDAKAAQLFTDQLEESLRVLRVETIDCYMIQGVEHEWIVSMDSLYEAFSKARKAGKVRFFGLSTHTNVPKVCALAAGSGRYDVVMLAVNPNSLKDLSPAIKALRDANVGVVGMKTGGPIGQDRAVYDAQYGPERNQQGLSPWQRAYVYMLARGGIDAFIAHTPNRKILEEDLAAAGMTLSRGEVDGLERQVLAEARGACRHCGRCGRACPLGLAVSDLLRCHAYAHRYGRRDWALELYQKVQGGQALACTRCGECRAACPEAMDLPGVIAAVQRELA